MGLHNTPPPGHPALQGNDLVEQLEALLSHYPSDYGYLEAGWTVDLVRQHLHQHDLRVSDATVRRRLQAGGSV
jgi:hypothetical protein